jgi:hypothetical protein
MTIAFTTLRLEVNPTAEGVAALEPILLSIKACGAGDRFPMEIILHLRRENIDEVREILADLEQAGFISNYAAQGYLGQVKTFESVVFR